MNEVPPASSNSLRLVAAIVSILVAVSPVWVPLLAPVGFWLARLLAMIGVASVAAVLTLRRRRLALAASPPFVLASLACVFYSLIPAIYASVILDGPRALKPEDGPDAFSLILGPRSFDTRIMFAVASSGEAAVLCFVGLSLIAILALDRLIGSGKNPLPFPKLPPTWLPVLILCAGLAFQLGKAKLTELPAFAGSFIDALPAVVTFGVAWLVRNALAGERKDIIRAVIAVVVGSLLMFPYQLKTAALFLAVCLLMGLLVARGRARVPLLIAVLGVPLLAVSIKLTYVVGALPNGEVLVSKIVGRQSETVYCLSFALREAANGGGNWRSGPFYFIEGFVPRLIWPDKPDLSHGGKYARAFCDNDSPGQSSSITLLGEPILRGGIAGSLAAGATWLGLMALTYFAWNRQRGFLSAVALGLSPWLIDFDQDFTLYVAEAVKNGIAMLAVGGILAYRSGRRSSYPMSA